MKLLNKLKSNTKVIVLLLVALVFSLYFRLYHIEFGLPHSFHADEPEIVELAVKYTFEIRDILSKTEYYRLTPISYVYGTFPAYFFTLLTMIYTKTNSLLGVVFDKTSIYIFLRSINAIISAALVPLVYLLFKKAFSHSGKSVLGAIMSAFLVALNWKLILHAHYINVDIIITVLLCFSYFFYISYLERPDDTKYTVLTALFYGLAVGTKVTVLISLPLYLFWFIKNKHYRNFLAFLFIVFGVLVFSNPFSLVFANDFVFRVLQLSVKENGLVFDSVDYGTFKYVFALFYILTPIVGAFSILGIYISLKENLKNSKTLFLVGHVFLYLVFFSLGSRRVDRWLLPILPICIMYASYFFYGIINNNSKYFSTSLGIFLLVTYLYFPILMLLQFSRYTPKAEAYLWMRDNISVSSNKLVITEEGLDPMNKLQGVFVLNYRVYESENAQFSVPEDPLGYDYVVLSSRPMQNFQKVPVKNKFPFYYEKWSHFENTVLDTNNFTLLKAFELPKPNLIEVSDVYIYESKRLTNQDSP